MKVAFTGAGAAGVTDRPDELKRQEGDCSKENKDCRVEGFADFKLEEFCWGGIKCLVDCAIEDLCD